MVYEVEYTGPQRMSLVKPEDQKRSNRRVKKGLPLVVELMKGGKGSGNFGHKGRPGEQGGSSSEGGGGAFPEKLFKPYLDFQAKFNYSSSQSSKTVEGLIDKISRANKLSPEDHQKFAEQSRKFAASESRQGKKEALNSAAAKSSNPEHAKILLQHGFNQAINPNIFGHPSTGTKATVSRKGTTLSSRDAGTGTSKTTHSLKEDLRLTGHWVKKGIIGVVDLLKGGPGSGNHGHAGRPGEVGGSMPHGDSGGGGGKGGKKDKPSPPKPSGKKEARNNHKRNIGQAQNDLNNAKKGLRDAKGRFVKTKLEGAAAKIGNSIHGLQTGGKGGEKIKAASQRLKEIRASIGKADPETPAGKKILSTAVGDLGSLLRTVIQEAKSTLVKH